MRDPARLPTEIFLEILGRLILQQQLSPRQIIQYRRVSARWNSVLRAPYVCHYYLWLFFPQCREMRLSQLRHFVGQIPDLPHNLRVEMECRARQKPDWGVVFLEVARRYHHLRNGTPREYLKICMPEFRDLTRVRDCPRGHPDESQSKPFPPGATNAVCPDCKYKRASWTDQLGSLHWSSYRKVRQYLSRRDGTRLEVDHPDPMWWYSQEDGLLVYPAAYHVKSKRPVPWAFLDPELSFGAEYSDRSHHWGPGLYEGRDSKVPDGMDPGAPKSRQASYQLFDPQTGHHIPVPFILRDRVIRRVRLAQGVLIFEWAHLGGYHGPVSKDHKHFVTVFDVVRVPEGQPETSELGCDPLGPREGLTGEEDVSETFPRQHYSWTWVVEFRTQWELPSLGLLLPHQNELDLESDMYRYSACLSAHTATHYALLYRQREYAIEEQRRWLLIWDISPHTLDQRLRKPILIRYTRLNEHGLPPAEGASPETMSRHFLRCSRNVWSRICHIGLDQHNVYLTEERHFLMRGRESNTSESGHTLSVRGFPVIPFPSDTRTRAAAGDHANVWSGQEQGQYLVNPLQIPVYGPAWMDDCPRSGCADTLWDGSIQGSLCRHTLSTAPTAIDDPPVPHDNRVSGHYRSLPDFLLPSTRDLGFPWNQSDASVNPLQPRGFPGFAPCWRHDQFPCLTVSTVTDYAAGVRFVARDDFFGKDARVRNRLTVDTSASASYASRGRTPIPTPPPTRASPDPAVEASPEPRDDLSDSSGRDSYSSYEEYYNYNYNILEAVRSGTPPGEVEMAVEGLWRNMMGRSTLAGDERFVIGQDPWCNITLVRF